MVLGRSEKYWKVLVSTAELWSKSRASLVLTIILICTEVLALLVPVEVENTTREGMSVASSFGLVFCGLIISSYSAWVASNFASENLAKANSAAQRIGAMIRLAAPSLIIGFGAYCLGWFTVMYRVRQVFIPDPRMFALAVVMLLGLIFGGLGIGLLLHRWIALPVSIVLFGGLQLAATLQKSPMISNMAGLARCCSTDSTPNPQVLLSVGMCYLGWFVAGVLTLCLKAGVLRSFSTIATATCGALVVAGLWGIAAVNGFNAGQRQAIDLTANLKCVAAGAERQHNYCFWPQEAEQWEALGENLVRGVQQLEDASGISLPRVFTTSKGYAAATGGEYVRLSEQGSVETVLWDLAMRQISEPTDQCMDSLKMIADPSGSTEAEIVDQMQRPQRMLDQAQLVHLWWASTADEGYLLPEEKQTLAQLWELPKHEQLAWVRQAREGVETCRVIDLPTVKDPSRPKEITG